MELAKGQIVTVTRTIAGSTVIVDAAATDVLLFLDDVAEFSDDGGQVTIDGEVYDYAADSVDRDANSLTISTGLSGSLTAYEEFVAVYPEAPTHRAEVLLTDNSGVTVPARVPHWARDLLREGPRDPDMRESVDLLDIGDDWLMLDIEFRHGERDATTTPIIVTTDDGESVRIDGDGISTYTNDPIAVRTIVGEFFYLATDGTHLYARSDAGIHKYDPDTGEELTSGFPIPGSFDAIAHDAGFLYVLDESTDDIRKFNASTGAETIGSGFPIAGTFRAFIAADAGFIYAVDDTTDDIRKYDASTGSQVLTGFPIAGTFLSLAAADGFLYAVDDTTDDIRKYDASTGAENTSGFPISGTFYDLAIANGALYATEDAVPGGQVHKYVAETGAVSDTPGFPLVGYTDTSLGAFFYLAAGGNYLFARDQRLDVRLFNIGENQESIRADSSDGSLKLLAVTASDLTATGNTVLGGRTIADYLLVTTTRATRTAAQNVAHNTTTPIQADTWDGSGNNGDTDFYEWDTTNHRYNILVGGVYDLSAMARLASNAAGTRTSAIRINGTAFQFKQGAPPTVSYAEPFAASGVYLEAGWDVDLTLFHTAGAGVNLSCAGSWLNIKRVGSLAA